MRTVCTKVAQSTIVCDGMAQTARYLTLFLMSSAATFGCSDSETTRPSLGFVDSTDGVTTAGDQSDGSDVGDGADGVDGSDGTSTSGPPDVPEPTGDPCIDGTRLSALVDIIVDPDPVGCPWGQGDNLDLEQGILTARDETVARIVRTDNGAAFNFLEDGGRVCDIRLDTLTIDDNPVAADFVYDDVLLVTINDAVVLASDRRVLDTFEESDGLYRYEWEDVRGRQLQFTSNQAYCLGYGSGSDCALPPSDYTGEFVISLGGEGFAQLKSEILSDGSFEMRFITVGDNDNDTDCRHNGYRMRAVMDVALPGTFAE
ncbi:MAG: hypothetical protein VX223_08480 [Myxococcota bacterium]|nr:hypothetical protein [Myxococcota bacterium]